jgi:ribosome-binding factor A
MLGLMSDKRDKYEKTLERYISESIPDLKDPRIPLVVTVERVRLNPDFSQAKVLVSTLGDEREQSDMLQALNGASGFLQREMGRDLELRKTPRLSFHTNPLEIL